jgi:methionine-rich copper-binding protein CopC
MYRQIMSAVGVVVLIAAPGHALAHAHLEAASPPPDASVATAPTEVALDFSEEIEPKFSKIEVDDAKGMRVDKGDVHLAAGNAKHFVVSLQPLDPGTYKVLWSVTSTDTHKTKGSYTFRLEK